MYHKNMTAFFNFIQFFAFIVRVWNNETSLNAGEREDFGVVAAFGLTKVEFLSIER